MLAIILVKFNPVFEKDSNLFMKYITANTTKHEEYFLK